MWRRAEEFVRRNWINLAALWLLLWLAVFAAGAYHTRLAYMATVEANAHASDANRNSAENNRILKERDFPRLFAEHEQHHREHDELHALLCALPELKEKCEVRK